LLLTKLLDNQADVSILHPSVLCDKQPATSEVNINGVGGLQFTISGTGYLDEFFRVYTSEDMHAKVLSVVEVEVTYPITYGTRESFVVHLPHRDITFKHRGKMYVADWNEREKAYDSEDEYVSAHVLTTNIHTNES
jgi:hypothetical protein